MYDKPSTSNMSAIRTVGNGLDGSAEAVPVFGVDPDRMVVGGTIGFLSKALE